MGPSLRSLAPRVAVAILAFVTAIVIAGDLARLHRAADRADTTATVAVAARDLAVGHRIAARDLVRRRVPGALTPADAIGRAAVGRFVRIPVLRDAVVTRRALTSRARALDPDERLATISVDLAPPLTIGSRVDVYRAGDSLGGEAVAVLAARRATVRSVSIADRRTRVTVVVRADDVGDVMAANGAGTAQLVVTG